MEPGSKAPAFTLPDHDGHPVALADLAGRWIVLFFYPRDDTPGCTVEACEFSAALPELGALDAVVLGCSADTAASHQKFRAKHRLGVQLLTDADRAVMRAYGAWGKKVMYGKQVDGVIRSTVLIAPDGRVAHHWPKVKAEGHAEQVRAKLAELQGTAAAPVRPTKATGTSSSPERADAPRALAKKSVPATRTASATKRSATRATRRG